MSLIDFFKKLWAWFLSLFTAPPEPVIDKTIMSFAIDDYPGTANDLSWCLNDQDILLDEVQKKDNGFWMVFYCDELVTKNRFLTRLREEISNLQADDWFILHYSGHGTQVYDIDSDEEDGYDEALYLYDTYVTDDELRKELEKIPAGAKVILIFDSCFSRGMLKSATTRREKFMQLPDHPIRKNVRKRLADPGDDLRWVVFSACQEGQYSYDNVFTPALVRALPQAITPLGWFLGAKTKMVNWTGVQDPSLDGPLEIQLTELFK